MDSENPSAPGQPGGPSGASLIRAIDPQGFTVILDAYTWHEHIIKRHPEMLGRLDAVTRAVERPKLIQRAGTSPTTCYYYRQEGASGLYVLAVVDRNQETRSAFVKTAHLVREMRTKGSETIWPARD